MISALIIISGTPMQLIMLKSVWLVNIFAPQWQNAMNLGGNSCCCCDLVIADTVNLTKKSWPCIISWSSAQQRQVYQVLVANLTGNRNCCTKLCSIPMFCVKSLERSWGSWWHHLVCCGRVWLGLFNHEAMRARKVPFYTRYHANDWRLARQRKTVCWWCSPL